MFASYKHRAGYPVILPVRRRGGQNVGMSILGKTAQPTAEFVIYFALIEPRAAKPWTKNEEFPMQRNCARSKKPERSGNDIMSNGKWRLFGARERPVRLPRFVAPYILRMRVQKEGD